MRAKTIKLLEENRNPHDLVVRQWFLGLKPTTQAMKEKTDQLGGRFFTTSAPWEAQIN